VEERSAAIEEVSSAMEEMAANIKQNSDNAQQTEKIALKAAEDAAPVYPRNPKSSRDLDPLPSSLAGFS
jgi:hypothetical protein